MIRCICGTKDWEFKKHPQQIPSLQKLNIPAYKIKSTTILGVFECPILFIKHATIIQFLPCTLGWLFLRQVWVVAAHSGMAHTAVWCLTSPYWYSHWTTSPGARLTKAYDVTIQRYRNSHAKTENGKMHILRCMGSKFCAKFQRCPLKFHTKFWTHTPQNMHFTSYQKFDDLWYLRVMTS